MLDAVVFDGGLAVLQDGEGHEPGRFCAVADQGGALHIARARKAVSEGVSYRKRGEGIRRGLNSSDLGGSKNRHERSDK